MFSQLLTEQGADTATSGYFGVLTLTTFLLSFIRPPTRDKRLPKSPENVRVYHVMMPLRRCKCAVQQPPTQPNTDAGVRAGEGGIHRHRQTTPGAATATTTTSNGSRSHRRTRPGERRKDPRRGGRRNRRGFARRRGQRVSPPSPTRPASTARGAAVAAGGRSGLVESDAGERSP